MFEKKHQNSGTLGKDTINNWIIPFLLDGSHTRCRQKGASAGYQARKKAVTTNSIFLCDNKGQMIANGWLDGYKGLIMRYEYLDVTWIGMLLLGFISKFLKKV